MPTRSLPFDRCYRVSGDLFLAGCYPGDLHADVASRKIEALLGFGIRTFVDLTEPRECGRSTGREPLLPYAQILNETAKQCGCFARRLSFPIQDGGVPDSETTMDAILSSIDRSMKQGESVYLHCLGGHGRTGMVVACWMGCFDDKDRSFRQWKFQRILADIARRRSCIPNGHMASPEFGIQREWVMDYLRRGYPAI